MLYVIGAYILVALVAKFDKAIGLGLCVVVTLGLFAAYSLGFLTI